MDEVRSQSAVLYGIGGAGRWACCSRQRIRTECLGLVLINSFARIARAPDYPWGRGPARGRGPRRDALRVGPWGISRSSRPEPRRGRGFRQWWARYQRVGASPGTCVSMRKMLAEIDVRDVLQSIRAPTLILHRPNAMESRSSTGAISLSISPGPSTSSYPASTTSPFSVTPKPAPRDRGVRHRNGWPAGSGRVLATMVFLDIVGSTNRAAELGDRGWSELLESHRVIVRRELERSAVSRSTPRATGFSPPSTGQRAVQCADVIRDAWGLSASRCGPVCIPARSKTAGGPAGIAVHIGSRVLAEAAPGEVLVSSTVKATWRSGLEFEDGACTPSRACPDQWRLFAVR